LRAQRATGAGFHCHDQGQPCALTCASTF
jgi:hypothetical protein